MRLLLRLLTNQSGASRMALTVGVTLMAYLALAGGWATAVFETIDRLAARLPL